MSKVGSLIKEYRVRKGISQSDLEIEIGAAFGSLSRFELGKVNPTKETLQKIIRSLDLSPLAAASLLGLESEYFSKFIILTQKIANTKDLDELIYTMLNEVNEVLDLLGAAFYILKDESLRFHALSSNNASILSRTKFAFPYEKIRFKLNPESNNPILRAYFTQEPVVSYLLSDFISPPVPKILSDQSQKFNKLKSLIAVPHNFNGKCYGVTVFGKLIEDKFEAEQPLLIAFADALAVNLAKLQ